MIFRGWWGAGVVVLGASAQAFAQAPATFEELARTAGTAGDLGGLVAPLVDECRDGDEVERARCMGIRRRFKAGLEKRRFRVRLPADQAVTFADYDARVKGFPLAVHGCLACERPVSVGGQKLFITLSKPVPEVEPLRTELRAWAATVPVAGLAEAAAWTRTVRPRLLTELVFAPADQPWADGERRGYAFRPLGARVFDRCTGEVLVSWPRSATRVAPDPDEQEHPVCKSEAAAPIALTEPPQQLGSREITAAMASMREQTDTCFRHFSHRGGATLHFVVGGDGVPQSITLTGSLRGTAMGNCLLEAAKPLRFPNFKAATQKFSYPITTKSR